MDNEIDRSKRLFRHRKRLVEIFVFLDVARDQHFGTDRIDKFANAAFHLRAGRIPIGKVSETERGPFFMKLLGDRPRDRIIVRNPKYQTSLACHQTHRRFLLQSWRSRPCHHTYSPDGRSSGMGISTRLRQTTALIRLIHRRMDPACRKSCSHGHTITEPQKPATDLHPVSVTTQSGYSTSSIRPTSMYCPPPVCLQWTAREFAPVFSPAAISGLTRKVR